MTSFRKPRLVSERPSSANHVLVTSQELFYWYPMEHFYNISIYIYLPSYMWNCGLNNVQNLVRLWKTWQYPARSLKSTLIFLRVSGYISSRGFLGPASSFPFSHEGFSDKDVAAWFSSTVFAHVRLASPTLSFRINISHSIFHRSSEASICLDFLLSKLNYTW